MHTEWCCCWSLAMYGWPVELKPCHDCQAPQIHRSLSKEQLLDSIGRMNESLHSDGHLHLRKWVFEKSGMPHPHHPCIHICRWPKMQRYPLFRPGGTLLYAMQPWSVVFIDSYHPSSSFFLQPAPELSSGRLSLQRPAQSLVRTKPSCLVCPCHHMNACLGCCILSMYKASSWRSRFV